ncbi:hypothetical protein GN156_06195 [bacterium LRH843]|nr:hypothetical protein [bacterium LRH843]
MTKRRLFSISVLALSIGLITGCGGTDDDKNVEVQPQEEQEVQDEAQEQEKAEGEETTLGTEPDLEKEIASEPGIENVMIQVVEGETNRVNADIVINADQKLTADEVADTYSKTIKEKYPDYLVDIIVVQDGKLVTQKTYE